VRSTFSEQILKSEEDVFLIIYSQDCEECPDILDEVKAIANDLAINKNLKFAKIDYSANEIREITVTKIPQVLFFSANLKHKPVNVNEPLHYQGMLKFLKEHVSFPWIEPKT